MLYVGLDYHLRSSTICVLDGNGKKTIQRTIKGRWPRVIEELEKIKKKDRQQMAICFEASCGGGHLHDKLSAIARRVVVAHPGQLRLIFRSKKKSDRVDAAKLATLLFLDQVPTVYVPNVDVRSWRSTIEYRSRLIGKRTRVKNEIRSLLRNKGIIAPKSLWGIRGVDWLKSVKMDNDLDRLHLDMLLDELGEFKAKIKRVEQELNKAGRSHCGVVLLMTIPGIGIRTAEALVAYIDNPSRFGRVNNIGSYFGLIPSQDESAGRNRQGHITRQGPPTIRRLLTEAAWTSIKYSPTVKAYYERVKKGDKDRKKIAAIATAHYLARVSISMLKTGETWREAA